MASLRIYNYLILTMDIIIAYYYTILTSMKALFNKLSKITIKLSSAKFINNQVSNSINH